MCSYIDTMTSMNRLVLHACLLVLLVQLLVREIAYSDPSQNVLHSTTEEISYDDGPHVYWRDDSTAVVLYFIDGEFIRRELPYQPHLTFNGFAWDDTITYTLHPQLDRQKPEIMSGVSRILAMSDIHGEYEYFVEILQKINMIDSARHWTWGNGHLVIVGDVFDRGDRVTECLWLIYQLELEAKAAGGAVHYLLGNHELMVLRGDLRYVNEKYLGGISRRNRINYADLFGPDMELGRWLRSKNTIVRLNDILFMHGGLSPAMIDSAFSISEVNHRMRELIDLPAPELLFNQRSMFLTKSLGPLWYRGYHLAMEGSYEQATTAEVDRVLKYFEADAVVVGHTGVDSVLSLYDSRVFAVDIPFEEIHSLEALLWNDSGYYRVTGSGELRPLRP